MIFAKQLFHGKKILVTGANSGLGMNLSLELLKLGASVTGVSRSIDRDFFLSKVQGYSIGSFEAVQLDFKSDKLDFEGLSSNFAYDGIFLSAGISEVSSFVNTSEKTMEEMFNVNVLGQLKMIRYLLKKKQVREHASIIFMSSINGTSLGSKGHAIYAATKGALNGFTMSLANELSKKRIRVNAIAAGLIKTPMFLENLRFSGLEAMSEYEKSYPLGFGTPQDVTYLATFLLTDASKWITGQTYIIDGGHSIS